MSIADGELTSIALCWRLERKDGAGIALTSHDRPLLSEGILYDAAPGMMPASITRSLGLNPSSSEVAGALSSAALDESDLELGRWDGASAQLNAIDWEDAGAEAITLLAGEIGAVTTDGESFTADLSGAAAKLDRPVCPATSAECRAHFGDKQCRVDLAGRTIVATVVSSTDATITLDESVDDKFILGRLRYMSGANCGLSTIILSAGGTQVQIRDLPHPFLQPCWTRECPRRRRAIDAGGKKSAAFRRPHKDRFRPRGCTSAPRR